MPQFISGHNENVDIAILSSFCPHWRLNLGSCTYEAGAVSSTLFYSLEKGHAKLPKAGLEFVM